MAAENKALQDKMDREAKALQEKMKEENEKRSMESKALADRLEEVSRYIRTCLFFTYMLSAYFSTQKNLYHLKLYPKCDFPRV